MAGTINLRKLTLDELTGVVSLYPWYGAARKELCRRMSQIGGDAWGRADYGAAALYVGSRSIIGEIFSSGEDRDYSDAKVHDVLKSYIREDAPVPAEERKVRVVGGDFFSQAQYDRVRESTDSVFSGFSFKAGSGTQEPSADLDMSGDICTETLAQIYAEQGYYAQAKRIYSRLLLNFPEKNTYFASLIGQVEQLENK